MTGKEKRAYSLPSPMWKKSLPSFTTAGKVRGGMKSKMQTHLVSFGKVLYTFQNKTGKIMKLYYVGRFLVKGNLIYTNG